MAAGPYPVTQTTITCPYCGRIQLVAAITGLNAGQAVIQIKCSRTRCGKWLTIDLSEYVTAEREEVTV